MAVPLAVIETGDSKERGRRRRAGDLARRAPARRPDPRCAGAAAGGAVPTVRPSAAPTEKTSPMRLRSFVIPLALAAAFAVPARASVGPAPVACDDSLNTVFNAGY